MPKRVKWVIFGLKISIAELFSKSVQYVFLRLYLMTDINEWVKVTVVDF